MQDLEYVSNYLENLLLSSAKGLVPNVFIF